ncbi:ephrin type-A receptor 6-like [Nylanderia fulva]|uniref:ephrin type-A receptor 6-like n=1 Tax=Nylanderia fulva TaxID=613905 RepID=UPI0010FB168B|nr:ephrin type-A receptor 6-like [Nylanderia fulva]
MNEKYLFRVQATNAYGSGKWSGESRVVDLTSNLKLNKNEILTVQYVTLILSIIATIVIYNVYYFYCCKHWQRKKSKQIIRPSIINIKSTTANETSFINYELHSVHDPKLQSDINEFASIIIDKKQITLENLLGSGAFGEVYRGVKNGEGSEIMPVAIKMLRKMLPGKRNKNSWKRLKL